MLLGKYLVSTPQEVKIENSLLKFLPVQKGGFQETASPKDRQGGSWLSPCQHKYLPACPGKRIFEKRAFDKYILVFTCPIGEGEADFMNTGHIFELKMAQIHKHMQIMQQN